MSDPNELSELFDRDPIKLSEQDIRKIVARMRESQAQYELGVKAPTAPRPKRPSKKDDLLKDLGLK